MKLGSVYGQIGVNASFKFNNSKSDFLKRIKPRIGIYHSKRRFFSYNIRKNERHALDTLFFVDPQYPPLTGDSLVFKNINYSYTSKQIYFELGANIDIYSTRFFILYTGLIYAHGFSYDNAFYIRQQEYNNYVGSAANTEIKYKEPSSQSSRITMPLGVLFRFSKRKNFSPGLYAEFSPG